jgi:hypothetical protein
LHYCPIYMRNWLIILYYTYCNLIHFCPTLSLVFPLINYCWFSCEIVAFRENFADRSESYDSFCAKSYVFLAHSLGYISPFPYTTWPKARYQKIPMTFIYYSRTITNHTKLDFPLLHVSDKTSRSRILQMTSEKFSVGLSRLL